VPRRKRGRSAWKAMADQRSPAQPSANAWTADMVGWRSNAADARHGRACRWMLSVGHVTHRSGSWSGRSDAAHAARANTSLLSEWSSWPSGGKSRRISGYIPTKSV